MGAIRALESCARVSHWCEKCYVRISTCCKRDLQRSEFLPLRKALLDAAQRALAAETDENPLAFYMIIHRFFEVMAHPPALAHALQGREADVGSLAARLYCRRRPKGRRRRPTSPFSTFFK